MGEDEIVDAEIEEIDPVVVGTGVVVREQSTAMVAQGEITVSDLLAQSAKIEEAMRQAMTEDVHYGKIPGVKKPSLLKPGAEKLLVLFRLAPHYKREQVWGPGDHMTVTVTCELHHAPTGIVVATGEGMCSTRESRYAYRKGERTCPECGEPQVREGKPRDGRPGNWYCWKKEGGCGATWPLDGPQAEAFRAMQTGRVDNPDIPDSWNTVLKMADKRALIAAILNGTAASDVFTQDVEDSRPARSGSEGDRNEPPAPEREFDPGETLLPNAIKGSPEAPKLMSDALNGIDPAVDWKSVLDQCASLAGVEAWRDIPQDRKGEFWVRLSNTIAKIQSGHPGGGEFPPIEHEAVIAAFAWGFQGVVVSLPPREPAPAEPTPDDPPASDAALTAAQQAELDEAAAEAAMEDAPF